MLGQNFKTAGFADAETMVQHMVASENEQLAAMVSFMSANGIDKPLAEHDWAGFARRYNGPDYAAHNYNGLLADAFARYSARLPDLQVRTIQVLLTYKGFSPGTIDGVSGSRTTAAIEAFQRSIGKSATGEIDAQLISDLNAQG